MNHIKVIGSQIALFLFFIEIFAYGQMPGMGDQSQMGREMACNCPNMMKTFMQHPGGIFVIVLLNLLIVAAISVLICLSAFLIRKSRA